jgi:hypothetical protein
LDNADDSWEKGVPDDLIPAVKHLRESFHDAHFGCGQATRLYCYAALHNEPADDPDKGFLKYLLHIQKTIPSAETRQFADLLKTRTPPATFKAYYDLYVNGTGVHALHAFANLIQIGRANEDLLSVPFLVWAEAQAKHLIRSEAHQIRMWVQQVCHKQKYDPNADSEEQIFWRKWQAPSLIIMTPSRRRPYDAEKAWKLNDPETSAQWLKVFEDDYVLRLGIKVSKAAGEAAVALAKQPKPAQTSPSQQTGPTPNQGESDAASQRPGKQFTLSLRREARKQETQARNARLNKAYSRLAKKHPDQTDRWYAQKICKLKVGKSLSAETIRKHMKK